MYSLSSTADVTLIARFLQEQLVTPATRPTMRELVRKWTIAAGKIDIERKRRERARDDYIRVHGTTRRLDLYPNERLPSVIHGWWKCLFPQSKPNEGYTEVTDYVLRDAHGRERIMYAWLPDVLAEANDPDTIDLLLLNREQLTSEQKVVVLAAFHDAISRAEPVYRPDELAANDELESAGYVRWYSLVMFARCLATSDDENHLQQLSVIKSWVLHEQDELLSTVRANPHDAPRSPTGFMSGKQLVDAYRITSSRRQAFLLALNRRRKTLDADCWEEVANHRRNQAQFRYLAESPEIRNLVRRYIEPE